MEDPEVDTLEVALGRLEDSLREVVHELDDDFILLDWVMLLGVRSIEEGGHLSLTISSEATPGWSVRGLLEEALEQTRDYE